MVDETLPEKSVPKQRFDALNSFLALNGCKPLQYMTHTPFHQLGRSAKYDILRNFGSGVSSLLQTMSQAEDKVQIWTAAKNSKVVERAINPTPFLTDLLLRELIISWNNTPTRQARRQLLSILPMHYRDMRFLHR